jgi:hypothetical protein
MDGVIVDELNTLARAAAEQVAGPGAIEQIEIESGVDFDDRPAYHFSFLIDQKRATNRLGLIMIRLRQRLGDDLAARGDTHIPIIRILDREDWGRRGNA